MELPLSLVAGGTGLVGSHIIKALSEKSGKQIILARSFNSDVPKNAELEKIDFDKLVTNKINLKDGISHVYLCLGKRLSTYELGYMQNLSLIHI